MNVDTGQIYRDAEIAEAFDKGEALVRVTHSFADFMESLNEIQRRKVARNLMNIRRCQPHLSVRRAEELAQKNTVL